MVEERYKINGYYPTIGIECHVQLKTKTKLFASVSNEAREAKPNTLVSHICFGLPGALPVLNQAAVDLAAKAAFALGTTPQPFSKFDRKHYFYPDLPKGYQISQFDQPIILGGTITIYLEDSSTKSIAITRAHLEEDAGKSTHPAGEQYSLVDLNRAGTPLLEIVSEPEIHNANEAKAYVRELWLRMKYAGVSDVDLYHGNMRFDVNVSVSKDPHQLGIRSETKNLNSFRSVERAVDFEINRQISLLNEGGEVVQETRGWLDDKQITVSQRSKENAHDYRYFPDPDIPPIILDEHYIASVAETIPDMPDVWRERLKLNGVNATHIETMLESQIELEADFLSLFCDVSNDQAVLFSNWVVNIEIPLLRANLLHKINEEHRSTAYSSVSELVIANKLSSNNAKLLLEHLLTQDSIDSDIEAVAEKNGWIQMNDVDELEKIIDKVIADNPDAVADVVNGEMKAIGFLTGQVMKLSQGKANPAEAQKLLREKLSH